MSWCFYEDLKRRAGAFLRVRHLSDELQGVIPKGHLLHWVKVDHCNKKNGTATLCFGSSKPGETGRGLKRKYGLHRYTVTVITVPEDPHWVVEGK